MSRPIIRVFLSKSTRPRVEPIYHGPHPTIPSVGEHVSIEYDACLVWKVEHILSNENDSHTNADVYVTQNRPNLITGKSYAHPRPVDHT